jgi:1,2-diacylglycerol 3-alpha-glucosyltransferase
LVPKTTAGAPAIRIAFFSDAYHPRVSGQVTSIDEFCKCLTERGHEVRIVCPAYPSERMDSQSDLFPTIRVPSASGIVSDEDRLAIPWRGQEALRQLEEFDPNAVHIQTEFTIGNMGRLYCKRRKIPVLSTCHTHYEMYLKEYLPFLPESLGRKVVRSWLKSAYANDDLIIAPSRNIRDVMRGYGIDTEYVVIPNGVDERIFHPYPLEAGEFRKKLAERHAGFDEGRLLVYVGRIRQEKNLDLLAEAMIRVFREEPETHLLIVGEGSRKAGLQDFFQRHGLDDKVAWSDYMPRAQLAIVYSAADIFVFPSKTENNSLVTIEAMLCATPVVGVNRMGTAEILEGDKGGFLAEDDAEDFAEKILSLLRDPELLAAKSAEALEHSRHWTIDNSCNQMERIYERLFGSGNKSGQGI